MRRLACGVALCLLATSCAPNLRGPARPIAEEQLVGGLGLDLASARQTAIAFLRAYAAAPQDDAAGLAPLVATDKLADWVHWLGVQNREFAGTIHGSLELRSVQVAGFRDIQGALGIQVNVTGTVTFDYAPAGGQPFQRTRLLDGPILLVRVAPGDWRVVDLTRDGRSLVSGITIFPNLAQTIRGVYVRIDSLFQFSPEWQFNLVVENHSGHDITIDGRNLALSTRGGAAGRTRVSGVLTPSLARVPDGSAAQGSIAFPEQTTARGLLLSIPFRLHGGGVVSFDFPLGGLVTPAAVPASPSP